MGLETSTGRSTFVNIKEGRLYTKEKDKAPIFFNAISGTIAGVNFKEEEYEGKKYEKMELILMDGEDKFVLSIRTDSGYFRGFCNSLRSGNPTEKVRITPNYKLVNDKPQTTCFVSQNDVPLKHAFTKDHPGDYPQLEKINFRGQELWDGSKQVEYWKRWINSIKWANNSFENNASIKEDDNQIEDPQDDLPF